MSAFLGEEMNPGRRTVQVTVILFFFFVPLVHAGELLVRIRDAETGRRVSNARVVTALLEQGTPVPVPPSIIDEFKKSLFHYPSYHAENGVLRLNLPGKTLMILHVEAPGYREQTTWIQVPAGNLPVTLWLDPVEPAPEMKFWRQGEPDVPGMMVLHGHVYDGHRGTALKDVEVSIPTFPIKVTTDERGYYRIYLPVTNNRKAETFQTISIQYRRSGFKVYEIRNVLFHEVVRHDIVDLEPGEGKVVRDDRHPLTRSSEPPHGHEKGLKEDSNKQNPEYEASTPFERERFEWPLMGETKVLPMLAIHDPPDTIRVGTGCSCTSCSGVSVMSLETYVKRGLNDEWIASWVQHSLRSGSIPYRSYGVWYVYHPISGTYDICSTTCCQVNDTDTSASTDQAVEKTSGILLEKNGSIARSEYSAENNAWNDPNDGLPCSNPDLSCGDGYAGSPAYGWPCLSDPPGIGHGCFGHGRGMCQWGTQRWASQQGALWNWIVNHYYNANDQPAGERSQYMTSPIEITGATPSPSVVSPGGSFTIQVDETSFAELTHTDIMIGASLYSAATGYIDDPANDTVVTIPPGTGQVSRPFNVPPGTIPGTYDLLVALWLDVDENQAITGSDLALDLYTLTGAVEVVSCVSDSTFDWKADFYEGINFDTYIFSKSTARPDGVWSNWGDGSPFPGCVPPDRFSARWEKSLTFEGGLYRFTLGSDDGSRLYIDGILQSGACNAWYDRPYTEGSCDVMLSAGSHTLRLEFYENTGVASLKLDWCRYPDPPVNPSPPDGGTACPSPTLSWAPSRGAVSYDVYGDGNLICTGVTTPSCTVGWTSGSHSWYVVAHNACGDRVGSTWSVVVDSVPPPGIGNTLSLTKISAQAVRLTWTASSDASTYRIYRKTSAPASWSQIGSTSSNSFDDISADASLLFYSVTAVDTCGNESSH